MSDRTPLRRLELVLDDADDAAERCADLDLRIQRALRRRQTMRILRTDLRSPYDALAAKLEEACVELARALDNASTRVELDAEDLYAWCAWIAREIDLTESLALPPFEEWERMEAFAPRAISALEHTLEVTLRQRELTAIKPSFDALRAHLGSVLRAAWAA